jgi:hypothetical protein
VTVTSPIFSNNCNNYFLPVPGATPDQAAFVAIASGGTDMNVGQTNAAADKVEVRLCAARADGTPVPTGRHVSLRVLLA